MTLTHEQYCAQIAAETAELVALVREADLGARVPSCPDWTLEELAVHVGQAHRWADQIVRTRATSEVEDEDVRRFTPQPGDQVTELAIWLREGAELLVTGLREAGADAGMWSWFTEQNAGFWARRMTHETVVHRADACLAVGARFTTDPEVAADTIEEWLTLVSAPATWEEDEELRELRRWAGRSLRLRAIDTAGERDARWLIELGTDGVSWRRAYDDGDGEADVALTGPLDEVLRVFYRRLEPTSDLVRVHGDAELLDFWLERVSFGG